MKPVFQKLAIALSVVLLAACAMNGQYRTDLAPCTVSADNTCHTAAIQQVPTADGTYHLGFIEFDDQGQLRQREQMQQVVDHMTQQAALNDVILTVFVHGWHHSAAPGDDNIIHFKKLLAELTHSERVAADQQHRKPREILGVYIGWRGDSIDIPVINDLTFWERKNTAQKVGLQGVTEALLKLEQIVNVKNSQDANPKQRDSRMVVVGHSFGGAVVFTALQQLLEDRYYQTDLNYSRSAKGFADLTLLINPAFEALRYSTLYDIGQQQCRRYWPDQLPRLVIMTSEADLATRYAFPLGRIFSTAFETHDDIHRIQCTKNGKKPITISEWKADLFTVGHFKPYWTHTLTATPGKTRPADFNYRALSTRWSQQQFGDTLQFNGAALHHLGVTNPLNPYLNIRVGKKLISSHNDIWGDDVVSFVRDLIMISTMPAKPDKAPPH